VSDEKDDRAAGPVIVWIDYGTEGWQPRSFGDEAAAVAAIMGGDIVGRCVLTRRMRVGAWLPSSAEKPL
jgi:hypothetical protein